MEKEINHPEMRDPRFLQGMLIPWLICLLASLFYCYDYFLRVTPSVMIHPLMQAYHISALQIGFLSAFYYYAYTPMQIPSGVMLDKYNRRLLLSLSVLCCAIGAFISAIFVNFYAALIGRFLMGFGSAFAFVGALKLAAVWLPRKRFALFSGVASAMGVLGAIFADIFLSRLVKHLGWRQSLLMIGYAGILLFILVLSFVHHSPPWRKPLKAEAKSWRNMGRHLLTVFMKWRFWLNSFIGCALYLPINVFASLWGVAFITHYYEFPAIKGATLTSLIFIGTVIGSPISGWFSDFIGSRRIPLLIGGLGAIVFVLMVVYVPPMPHWLLYICLFLLGVFVSTQVLVFAIAREISPPHSTGMATAGTNFMVTLGAAVLQPLIGYFLDVQWAGKYVNGAHYYTTLNFQYAFIILPLLLLVSFLCAFITYK